MSDHTTRARVAVISRYDVPSVKQQNLATALHREVRNWICKRPGFVSGTVHSSIDQLHVVVYTLWDREDDAMNYMECPEGKGLWDLIMVSGSRLSAKLQILGW
jgi:hypothetical protein